jgi:hypothetical protein
MKSVIIKTLKEDVYDQDEYIKERCEDIAINKSKDGFYGSLKRFTRLIYSAIATSFLSAISQFTIGFLNESWSSIICLVLALISWVLLGLAVYFVQSNWIKAIDFANAQRVIEQKANIKKLES